VVGPSGEHIYTDKYGRVKVQFHWDRLGQRNEKSTCWMRVSQPWAGKGFGAMSIPRIGDEVVVSFLEGDPDQPLITGRVYNAQFMPPYALPANKTVTGILTRSMGKTSAAEANELRFEDAPGKEYIWLQAQKDFHREVENNDHDTVKNDQYITVAKKRQEDIGTDLEQTVGGKVKQSYASDHHHQVSGDYLHESGGVINLKSGGEFSLESGAAGGIKTSQALDIKAGMDLKAEGGMNVHIKGGMNVTIEAGMTLTLKAGAGSIVIGPATIAIDAPMVNINGGGGGGSASAANPKAPAKPAKAVKPKAVKDPITPVAGGGGGAAAKTAPAAKKAAPPAAKSAPAAKKSAASSSSVPAAKTPAAKKAALAAKTSSDGGASKVKAGVVTYSAEGNNVPSSPYYSRAAHWPGGSSGVTIGRGYDMGSRSEATVKRDLMQAGVPEDKAAAFAKGAGLTGEPAHEFVKKNKATLGEISEDAQANLFNAVYPKYEKAAQAAYEKKVANVPGAAAWSDLKPAVKDVAVDFAYQQGDLWNAQVAAIAKNDPGALASYVNSDPRVSQYEKGRQRAKYLGGG
jgi:Type VI secretion system/phage-baseplate injector OB domain/Bacterial toxin homologue of phage lysozyme, C-term